MHSYVSSVTRCSIVGCGHRGKVHGLELQIRLDPEIGLGAMSLGEEEAESIHVLILEIQSIQFDRLLHGSVHSTHVDDQFVIDEDPDIVISTEGEDLCAVCVVGEFGVQLEGEVEVSVRCIGPWCRVSEQLIFDREETTDCLAPRRLVTVEDERAIVLPFKLEFQGPGHVDSQDIIEPHVEAFTGGDAAVVIAPETPNDVAAIRVVDRPADRVPIGVLELPSELLAPTTEDRLPVLTQFSSDVHHVLAESAVWLAFEIRMSALDGSFLEIPDHTRQEEQILILIRGFRAVACPGSQGQAARDDAKGRGTDE